MWSIVGGGTLRNPIIMYAWSNTLAQQTYQLKCSSVVGSEIIISATVNISGKSVYEVSTAESPTFPQIVTNMYSTDCIDQY